MQYFVYILRCKDGSYYTGHTKDIKKRFEQHKNGRGCRYTRLHEPKELVYIEKFKSLSVAIKRERQIKTFGHERKSQLINNQNTPN
jgi:putative endonuclease